MRRLLDHGYPIDHATDHGGTVSVYLADPDGNGVELYYDRPRADWFDADGRPVLKADRFDYHDLLPTRKDPEPMYAQLIEGGTTPDRRARWTASSPTRWSPRSRPSPASPAR